MADIEDPKTLLQRIEQLERGLAHQAGALSVAGIALHALLKNTQNQKAVIDSVQENYDALYDKLLYSQHPDEGMRGMKGFLYTYLLKNPEKKGGPS